MHTFGRLAGAGAALAWAAFAGGLLGAPTSALADPPGYRDHGGYYRYVYDDGICRYKYRAGPYGVRSRLKCRRGARLAGAPWARHEAHRHRHYRRHVWWAPPPWAIAVPRAAAPRIVWRDPGPAPAAAPTAAPAPAPRYCREYQTTAQVDGTEQPAYGRACRMPDGSWKLGELSR